MPEIIIQPVQPEDLSEALNVFGEAFATLSSSIAIYKGRTQSDVERCVQITFSSVIKYQPGQVFVAKHDQQVVGVMRIVEWPDCQTKPRRMLRALPNILRAIRLGEMRRAMKMQRAWAKKDPKKPHWHLGPIAVKPALQGQSIGSQMMEYYCNHVNRLGMAAYHETDSRAENVKFYQRFGFQVIGEETIMDFPVWYLWRPSRHDTA